MNENRLYAQQAIKTYLNKKDPISNPSIIEVDKTLQAIEEKESLNSFNSSDFNVKKESSSFSVKERISSFLRNSFSSNSNVGKNKSLVLELTQGDIDKRDDKPSFNSAFASLFISIGNSKKDRK